jgi:two-component system, NarL family, response regulator DegU
VQTINIIIADDHPLFRSGVRSVLEKEDNFKILAESGSGRETLDLIIKLKPDVAVLDFQMPDLNGIEITEKLRVLKNPVKIILLTMHDAKRIFFKALDAGVNGYLLKDDAVLEIVNAIYAIQADDQYISKSLVNLLVKKAAIYSADDSINKLLAQLTFTENKILSLIADLKTTGEIADILFISKRTIENHKVNISRKLRLESSRDLLRFVIQNSEYIKQYSH